MAATININNIYLKLISMVNVQQMGQIRPVSDYQYWLNAINNELFHEKVAAYQLGQMNTDELTPFIKKMNVAIAAVPGMPYGVFTLPADYEYLIAIRVIRNIAEDADLITPDGKCVSHDDPDFAAITQQLMSNNRYEADIQVVTQARWSGYMDSLTKKPTFQSPKSVQQGNSFKVAPAGIGMAYVEYFRTPRQAVFGYTIGSGDIIIYDPGTSVQLEWTNIVENEFLARLVKKYGLRVRDDMAYKVGDNDKKELV